MITEESRLLAKNVVENIDGWSALRIFADQLEDWQHLFDTAGEEEMGIMVNRIWKLMNDGDSRQWYVGRGA